MTRSEEILRFNKWADLNLLRRGEREKCIDYIYDTYADGYEVVDRKIDEDTASREEKKIMTEADYAELDKDIADSMRFDNELSEGEVE